MKIIREKSISQITVQYDATVMSEAAVLAYFHVTEENKVSYSRDIAGVICTVTFETVTEEKYDTD